MITSLKSSKKNQIIIRVSLGLFIIFILSIASYFLFRQSILSHYSEKITESLSKNQKISISYNQLKFKGSDIIYCEHLLLKKENDTLLYLDTLRADISLWHLLRLTPHLDKLDISEITIHAKLPKTEEQKVDSSLIKQDSITPSISLSDKAYHWINSGKKYLPKSLQINRMNIISSITDTLCVEKIMVSEGNIFAYFPRKETKNNRTAFILKGNYYKSINIQLLPYESNEIVLPKIQLSDELAIRFDSASINIKSINIKKKNIHIQVSGDMKGLKCFYKKLGKDTLYIDTLKNNFDISIKGNTVDFSPSTYSQLNKIKIPIQLTWKEGEYFQLEIPTFTFESDDLFKSLPKGMFYSLSGITSQGKLTYHLNFIFPFQEPEKLVFTSSLEQHQFKILKYGNDNYHAANDTFWHSIYENGILVRKIFIGENNPQFHKYQTISKHLISCVLTSEDGSFFYHKGFNEESIKASIIENYQKGRFARGGSTISMQWVKNMYLSRHKTISRKLEEMMIVWLIENKKIVSKERMLEIYLNFIEWGKGVYGIGEASAFYFNKKPSELNLSESLYLSCIIPRPKHYQYIFEENGITKAFYKDYCRRMIAFMLRKEWIIPKDTIELATDIHLNGNAASVFNDRDSTENIKPEIFFEEMP